MRGANEFRCRDRLADVSLRMICNVYQQSSERRWQGLPSYHSICFEISADECSQAISSKLQRVAQLRENILGLRIGAHLRSQAGHLDFSQWPPFRISQKPIDAPRNMPDMKRRASHPGWSRIQLLSRQVCTPARQIFFGQLQRVQHRALHRRNLRSRSAKPRFSSFRFVHFDSNTLTPWIILPA